MTDRNDQGTGKHPHKSTEEAYPHREGKDEKGERGREASSRERGASEHGREGQQSGSSDLKEREYRDAQGNVHHHTHTYEEQHGTEK